ncbi:NtaA/DmoA family FMN-dependent monooxygenase [Gordonia sp. NPDC003376]
MALSTSIHTHFSLGLFSSFAAPAWQAPSDRLHGDDWWSGEFFADLAEQLEEAKMDFLFFEDTSAVSTTIGGTMDADLKFGIYSPKHDPVALLAYLSARTTNLGLIATASTTFYPPWLLARTFATIDGLSGGRVGWNIVTSADTPSGQNFGMDELPSHGERYAMADEYLEVVKKLWDSWEEGSLVRDTASNTYIDPSKVHHIDHDGTYFKVRGPLNTLRSPQGHPLLVQAGSSPRGRDFAARHAEVVFAPADGGIEGMKAYRDDIRSRAERSGRDPDEVKVIFAAYVRFVEPGRSEVIPAPTEAELDYLITFLSGMFDTDLTEFDLDAPFPADLAPRGHTGMFETLQDLGRQGVPLRDALGHFRGGAATDFVGTPERVGDKLIDAMDRVGGDGFMIIASNIQTPSFLCDVTHKLVPHLRSAGVIRADYNGGSLRESLLGGTRAPVTADL